jgi:3-oxoacyl-[acyl-carrier protein] reductase
VSSRRWFVTGASRGIGAAVARRAHESGDKVAMIARSTQVVELAEELGPRALGIMADVLDGEVMTRAVDAACGWCGGIDVLVNNAGAHRGGRIGRLSREAWEEVLHTNLTSVFVTTRLALERMEAGSAIINVGSVSSFRGFPGDIAYASSKAGLAGFTRNLAVELGSRGITANLIVPGFVDTEMTRQLSPKAHAMVEERIPIKRLATPDEIADVVYWMAGTPYMTGAEVAVDGGLMAALGSA